MGRHRKTLEELERSGTLKAHPGRYKDRLSAPTGKYPLGPPPKAVAASPELVKCWNEVLEATKEVKLCSMDALHVEMTARLVLKCRQPHARSADFAELARHFSKFGLTKTDRTRVVGKDDAEAQKDRDVWEWLAQAGAPPARKN